MSLHIRSCYVYSTSLNILIVSHFGGPGHERQYFNETEEREGEWLS